MSLADPFSQEEQAQATYKNAAEARRICIVDPAGDSISAANPLPVDIQTAGSKTPAIEFQEDAAVVGTTVTTILSFTNSTGSDIFLDLVGGSGSARAEWQFLIGGSVVLKRRSGVANMNINARLFDFKVADSVTVEVKVEHFESAIQDFNAEVHYYS